MRTLTLLSFLITFSTSILGQSGYIEIRSLLDWEQALSLAERNRTMIFVFYTDDDCEPCETMIDEVFRNREVREYVSSNYIPVLINRSNANRFGEQFAEGFDIQSLPASVWITGAEFVWHIEEGAMSLNEFNVTNQRVIQLTKNYPSIIPYALQDGDTLSTSDWMNFLQLSRLNGTDFESTLLRSFERNLSWDSLRIPAYWDYVSRYVVDINAPIFRYIRLNPDSTLGPDFPWKNYCDELYTYHLDKAISSRDSLQVVNIEYGILPYIPHSEKIDSTQSFHILKLNLWQDYFLQTQQFDTYLTVTERLLKTMTLTPEIMSEEIRQLTRSSRANSALRAGLKWLKIAIEQEPDALYYIMRADLLIYMRERSLALEALSLAERHNPTQSEREIIEYLELVAREIY